MSRSTHTDWMGRDREGGATYLVKGKPASPSLRTADLSDPRTCAKEVT